MLCACGPMCTRSWGAGRASRAPAATTLSHSRTRMRVRIVQRQRSVCAEHPGTRCAPHLRSHCPMLILIAAVSEVPLLSPQLCPPGRSIRLGAIAMRRAPHNLWYCVEINCCLQFQVGLKKNTQCGQCMHVVFVGVARSPINNFAVVHLITCSLRARAHACT